VAPEAIPVLGTAALLTLKIVFKYPRRIRGFVTRASQDGGRAIVIPFRVQGFGPYADVLQGLDYAADQQGLIPHPEVTLWIAHEIDALAAGPFRAPLP
jgi:hypothetical protein